MNHEEVKLIFTVLNFVFHHHELEDIGTIGVIAAYKAQVSRFTPLLLLSSRYYGGMLRAKRQCHSMLAASRYLGSRKPQDVCY